MKQKGIQTTKLGPRIWFSVCIFGLIGQIAWIVENTYFSKFVQNNIESEAYATTLLVVCSAFAQTIATVIGGALCDKIGKRKIIVCCGYIFWGLSTMAFSLIPVDFSQDAKMKLVALVVIMDCVMSYIGSTANDAGFNSWVTDNTDTTNRGKVDVVLAIMPVAAMGVVFVGLDSLTRGENGWSKFFLILGLIPIIGGIIGMFLLKDAKHLKKQTDTKYWDNVFYSFRPTVIKENKMLYVCLLGSMCSGASIQVYQSYLINFVEKTLGITDYVVPLLVIVIGSAVISVVMGNLMDKFGKEKFYYPTIIANIVGAIIVYCLKFVLGDVTKMTIIICIGGILVMGASLTMAGLFLGAFRDYIPKGKEGSFMGMRMCLFVLVPMIIGPLVAQFIINTVNMRTPDGTILYPPELFLGGAVVVAFTCIPAYFVKKNDKFIRAKLIAEKENSK